MKKILIGLLATVSLSAFANSSNESVLSLCENHKKIAEKISFSSSYRFDFNKCILDGERAYSEGKLALARALCLKAPLNTKETGVVGRSMTSNCMKQVTDLDMSGSESFDEALNYCSRFKSGLVGVAKVGTRHSLQADEAEMTAMAGVYSCMNILD